MNIFASMQSFFLRLAEFCIGLFYVIFFPLTFVSLVSFADDLWTTPDQWWFFRFLIVIVVITSMFLSLIIAAYILSLVTLLYKGLIRWKNNLTLSQVEWWIKFSQCVKYIGSVLAAITGVLALEYSDNENYSLISVIASVTSGAAVLFSEIGKEQFLEPQQKRLERVTPLLDVSDLARNENDNWSVSSFHTAESGDYGLESEEQLSVSPQTELSCEDERELQAESEEVEESSIEKWKNINSNFTSGLIHSWISYGFTYEQCSDWISTNSLAQQNSAIQEPAYYAWLRDVKKVDSDWVHNYGNSEQLRQKFSQRERKQNLINLNRQRTTQKDKAKTL